MNLRHTCAPHHKPCTNTMGAVNFGLSAATVSITGWRRCIASSGSAEMKRPSGIGRPFREPEGSSLRDGKNFWPSEWPQSRKRYLLFLLAGFLLRRSFLLGLASSLHCHRDLLVHSVGASTAFAPFPIRHSPPQPPTSSFWRIIKMTVRCCQETNGILEKYF